jgi:hypothetical protein
MSREGSAKRAARRRKTHSNPRRIRRIPPARENIDHELGDNGGMEPSF